MPRMAKVAWVVAFVMAGFQVVAAARNLSLLPFAVIPLAAGIGILRRRAWSAYGFALLQFAQLLLIVLITIRSGDSVSVAEWMATSIILAGLACLFWFSGRALAATGAERGRTWPWITIALLSTVPLIFLQPFVIPTSAMEDTLLVGDRILVQRIPRHLPRRGDLVVFRYSVDPRQTFVKRVVGVGGDRIRVVNKQLYRNGQTLTEPYAVHKTDYVDPYRDNFPSKPNIVLTARGSEMLDEHVVNGEVLVPNGKYFVLGDNRDASLDSRYWGFVGTEDLLGRPLLIYDSRTQSQDNIVIGERPADGKVRWNRMFRSLIGR